VAEPTRQSFFCPVCKGIKMDFACRVANVEIYGCDRCGATLSIPALDKAVTTPSVCDSR
jgi:ribosomal protein L37AE/L43A